METRANELIEQGDELWSKRQTLMMLWQEIAMNFYVERADFTVTRTIGNTFADNLVTSYPLLARRDLGNSFSSMLRPTAKNWAHTTIEQEDKLDEDGRRWLEWSEGTQRRAMYDRKSQFTRATKEADHDFAAFGQAVLTVELNGHRNGLLYRNWHLRDVVWMENAEGAIDTVHRKWTGATARQVCKTFPKGNLHPKMVDLAEKSPFADVDVRHIVVPAEYYEVMGKKPGKRPFASVWLDVGNQHIIEEIYVFNKKYIIPRWQTVSGSQYAYSPATVAALPDGRLIQAMTLTLLEAGEKAANPPMIATNEAVRSDIDVRAGGLTWVDAEYDEKLGEALRPLTQDFRGFPFGEQLRTDAKEMILEAFYLNKLTMPSTGEGPEMTAFEVGQRVQEYIRQALPLFEPMELDYNGALCEETFDLMRRSGGFGSPFQMPKSLRGANIQFKFESPLNDLIEAQKGTQLGNAKGLVALVSDVDAGAGNMLDARVALRDALHGVGTPAKWVRDDQAMAAMDQKAAESTEAQQAIAGITAAGGAAKAVGDGVASLNDAGMGAPPAPLGAPVRTIPPVQPGA
jgi:hypothetical protein